MQQTIAYGLLLPLILFFTMLIPDFVMYSNYTVKAHTIATNAVEIAEKTGGFSYDSVDLETYVEEQLENNNMDPGKWQVSYTEGRVDYNEPLHITLKGSYRVAAFDMIFGEEENKIKILPIQANKSGVGQVFFR